MTIRSPISSGTRNGIDFSETDFSEKVKTFTIPDETDVSYIDPKQAQSIRENYSKKDSNISDYIKKQIETIVGIGRITRDITLMNGDQKIVFTLRSIKAKEEMELFNFYQEHVKGREDPTANKKFKILTLKNSLYKIDGIYFNDLMNIKDNSDEYKINMLESMDAVLINYLYKEYEKLEVEVLNFYKDKEEILERIEKSV